MLIKSGYNEWRRNNMEAYLIRRCPKCLVVTAASVAGMDDAAFRREHGAQVTETNTPPKLGACRCKGSPEHTKEAMRKHAIAYAEWYSETKKRHREGFNEAALLYDDWPDRV
jgi:hypothetical protein